MAEKAKRIESIQRERRSAQDEEFDRRESLRKARAKELRETKYKLIAEAHLSRRRDRFHVRWNQSNVNLSVFPYTDHGAKEVIRIAIRMHGSFNRQMRQWEFPSEVDSFRSDGVKKVKLGDLCYGRKALEKVVKWEGPMKFGDYQEAGVTYLYKIDGLADWAKRPDIQATFPNIARMMDGSGKVAQTHGVKLTSEGWEAKGLN